MGKHPASLLLSSVTKKKCKNKKQFMKTNIAGQYSAVDNEYFM